MKHISFRPLMVRGVLHVVLAKISIRSESRCRRVSAKTKGHNAQAGRAPCPLYVFLNQAKRFVCYLQPAYRHLAQSSAALNCSIASCTARIASTLWPQKSWAPVFNSSCADRSDSMAPWMFGQRAGTGTAMATGAGAAMADEELNTWAFGVPSTIANTKAANTTVKVIIVLFIFPPRLRD